MSKYPSKYPPKSPSDINLRDREVIIDLLRSVHGSVWILVQFDIVYVDDGSSDVRHNHSELTLLLFKLVGSQAEYKSNALIFPQQVYLYDIGKFQ